MMKLNGTFQGTQIQATCFNEAARKFYDKFELGKVYYISKGNLKVANKQFNTVKNDYEMTLNENSEVEEVSNEAAFVPATKFDFVPIDELGPYVNGRELVGKYLIQQFKFISHFKQRSDTSGFAL